MLEERFKIFGEEDEEEKEVPVAVLEPDSSSDDIDSETGEPIEFIPRRRLTAYK